MSWAVASPVGASPDDDFHLSSIWCANSLNESACLPGNEPSTRYLPEALHEAPLCYRFDPTESAACQQEAFDFDPAPDFLSDRGSFGNNYPPVYYLTMSAFVGGDIQASVVLMRVVNVLLFVGLTTVLFLLLPLRLRPALLWSWLISILPLGVFIIASNNPSAWALIGLGTSWLALLGYYETTGRRRVLLGVLFGLSAIMAAGSRADSAIYTGLAIALVVGLTFRRELHYLKLSILPAVLALVALFFYVTSGQSSVAVSGLGSIGYLGDNDPLSLIIPFNLANVTDLFAGSFGTWELGWLDVPMPPLVTFGAIVAVVGILFVGLGVMAWRKAVALCAVALALLGLPLYVLVAGNNFVGEVLQPRYLLPLILLFAGLALLPVAGRSVLVTKTQAMVVALGLAAANSLALFLTIRRFVAGLDNQSVNLNAGIEWWWPGLAISPLVVWAIGTLAFGAAVSILTWELTRRDGLGDRAALANDAEAPVSEPDTARVVENDR